MSEQNIIQQIKQLEEKEKTASIEKSLLLKEALESNNAELIFKAQNYLQTIQKREKTEQKSIILDPYSINQQAGWLEKQYTVSYTILRNMSRIPVIKAIIETRVEQIVDFCEPQRDKHSTGFVIRPKRIKVNQEDKEKLKPEEEKEIEKIIEFLLHCGTNKNSWHGDDFVSFLRKFVTDCLTLDQGTFEIVRNRGGELDEIVATDGATYRLADKWSENNRELKEIKGYKPTYVQVHEGRILSDFYPWELCFGIRNAQSSIYSNGYGRSELEDLIHTITSILHADQYNANYFKVGSNPKGILKVSGNINVSRIEEFRAQWTAQMAGVQNSHRMPIIEADKMDFITTQTSNKDMEYSKYYEFLIKLACACYKIDPSEIGFPMNGSSESKPMFEGSNAARLKFSKDKGLKPLLKFVQAKINKYIVEPLTEGKYEFYFDGLDSETAQEELENDIKKMSAGLMDLKTGMAKYGHKLNVDKDIILNPVFLQFKQMMSMGGDDSNQFMDEEEENTQENPFEKSMQESWNQLMNKE